MKVRWNDSSVRFRITPTELALLQRGERAVALLAMPDGPVWRAELRPGCEEDALQQEAGGAVVVALTGDAVARLSLGDVEGVYFRTSNGVRYYVEKDFPCVHPGAAEAAEPPTETFVPPAGFKERHTGERPCG